MKICRRIAVLRRQVEQLAATVAERAADTDIHAVPSFRPLTEAETDAIVGHDLLAALATGVGVPR